MKKEFLVNGKKLHIFFEGNNTLKIVAESIELIKTRWYALENEAKSFFNNYNDQNALRDLKELMTCQQ